MDMLIYRITEDGGETRVDVRRWVRGSGWSDVHSFPRGVVFYGKVEKSDIEKYLRKNWVGRLFHQDHPVAKLCGNPWANDAHANA